MIKIKMTCNWMSGRDLCNYWNKFTDGDYTCSKNNTDFKMFGEELSMDDADYIVVVNNCSEYISDQNLSKTIFMKMEPVFYTDFWENINSGLLKAKIVHGNDNPGDVSTNLVKCNPFEWLISKTKTELITSNYSENKIQGNRISSVISGKQNDEGHKIRLGFALYAQKFLDWDNYGNCGSEQFPWNNFLGSIQNKEDALIPYKYSFNCENNFLKGYVGEKLLDCILCETLCFYCGCPNIADFIDPRAFVNLDLGRLDSSDMEKKKKWDAAIQIIKNAIHSNLWEERLLYIKAEKRKILENTNLFSNIINIINI